MWNLTIHRKLILSYVFLAVLPTIILGIYLSSNIKRMTVDRAINDAVKNVEIIQSDFSRSLNVTVKIAGQLYLNKAFYQLVSKQYASNWDVVDNYFSFKDFEDFCKIYDDTINNMRIFVYNDTVLGGWYLYKITDETMRTPWYQLAVANPSKVVWYPTENLETFSFDKNCYSLVRQVSYQNAKAVIVIDLNRGYINNLLARQYFDTTIFDENGNVVYASDPVAAVQMADDYSFEKLAFHSGVMITDGGSDADKFKTIIKDMVTDGINGRFRIVSTFPLKDILYESNALFIRYMVITAVCLLFISALVLFFSRRLRGRVAVLSREMEVVSKGDFCLVSKITGVDEVGILAQSLNIMAENLKKLVAENYEANFQKQNLLIKHNDIKLKLLTNQMNPHFLFNTLESLRMEARIRNEMEISDIIRRLGGLLRKSIQTGSEELPLTEEISLVEDYLCIQAFRYGDRLQYAFSVGEEPRRLKILPFLIQPLVENAIVHGMENSEETSRININAYCGGKGQDESLYIEVIDDGAGITPEKLRDIRESLNDEESENLHIGIRNVHLRIRLRYGEPYGLRIEDSGGGFTKVILRLPKR